MNKLSTGDDSTLGNWIAMCTMVFGPNSAATKFLIAKANEQGIDEEVIADEGQMIEVLAQMHFASATPQGVTE